jgi:hypothetical protein
MNPVFTAVKTSILASTFILFTKCYRGNLDNEDEMAEHIAYMWETVNM